MTDTVLTSITDSVLHVEFNRPEKKNALTLAMYTRATQAIEQANADSAVRAVVISGRGDSFSAGNDLNDFLTASEHDRKATARFLQAVPTCDKPIIAAVQGHAVGIGTTLLLHCDLVYADASAKLQMPFVNLGLCPEFGSSLLLPRLIGQRKATELLLLGEHIDATTACEYGLVNAVVDDCLQTAMAQAKKLAAKSPAAIKVTRQLLRRSDQDNVLQRIKDESALFSERLQSAESKEAMTAFMEKRQADFSQFD